MTASDELTRIISPSLAEVGRAMIKDLSELAPSPVPRIEKDGTRIVTDVFKGGARLERRYSAGGDPLGFEAKRVKFERLGKEIYVSAA